MEAFSIIQPGQEKSLENRVSFSVPRLRNDIHHSLYIIGQIWPNNKGAAAMSWEGKANRRLMNKSNIHPVLNPPFFFLTRTFNQCTSFEGSAAARWVRFNRNPFETFWATSFLQGGTEFCLNARSLSVVYRVRGREHYGFTVDFAICFML